MLAALVPLAVLRDREQRLLRLRKVLGLGDSTPSSRVSLAIALVAVCGLVALAAAQLGSLRKDAVGGDDGPTIDREHEGRRRALMPYATLAALLPLGFVLPRRNL